MIAQREGKRVGPIDPREQHALALVAAATGGDASPAALGPDPSLEEGEKSSFGQQRRDVNRGVQGTRAVVGDNHDGVLLPRRGAEDGSHRPVHHVVHVDQLLRRVAFRPPPV
jgi:hypothetical protein